MASQESVLSQPSSLAENLRAIELYYTAAFCLLVYDYLLSIDEEVHFVWQEKMTKGRWSFILIQQSILGARIIMCLPHNRVDGPKLVRFDTRLLRVGLLTALRCKPISIASLAYGFLLISFIRAIQASRAFAVTRRNRIVLIASTAIGLTQLGIAIYLVKQAATQQFRTTISDSVLEKIDFQTCFPILEPPEFMKPFYTVYFTLSFVFDTFIVTTVSATSFIKSKQHPRKRWLRIALRDGILYYILISASTLVWVVFNQTALWPMKFINAGPDLIFRAVFVNRTYLSLKRAAYEEEISDIPFLGRSTIRHGTTTMASGLPNAAPVTFTQQPPVARLAFSPDTM